MAIVATVMTSRGDMLTSLFIDPDPEQITAAHELLHDKSNYVLPHFDSTGSRASTVSAVRATQELRRLRDGATLARQCGLRGGSPWPYVPKRGGCSANCRDHRIQHRS